MKIRATLTLEILFKTHPLTQEEKDAFESIRQTLEHLVMQAESQGLFDPKDGMVRPESYNYQILAETVLPKKDPDAH